ncbi:MAG: UDP-N-acetylmuramoyl-L-alanyl-D-glutamate--2,6-diaminopimelate ligase [Thermoproteota archaeon]|jgi:UDP-N-acetylmuramoyl-L-alanyl-D-glutamate--2,6-diaminopimelate ligase
MSNFNLSNYVVSLIYSNASNEISFDNLEWKSQESNKDSILFYSVKDTSKFKDRISRSKYAVVIINKYEESLRQIENVIILEQESFESLQVNLANELYPRNNNLKIIGITGTNGKTSIAHLLKEGLNQLGKSCLTIGTLGAIKDEEFIEDFGLTTPNYIDLRKYIHLAVDYCVIEISSHALEQKRLFDLRLDLALWTNVSQDHLDYHNNMDDYFKAKHMITDMIIDEGQLFISEDLNEENINFKDKVTINSTNIKLPTFLNTSFNRKNLALVEATINNMGHESEMINWEAISEIPGRYNIYEKNNILAVIDFAHTPDALDNICSQIKENYKQYSFYLVFGCGGDRDKKKRKLMGEIADKYCDEVFVTSDNPRTEDPNSIVDDILLGISKTKTHRVLERKTAIENALKNENKKKVVLIAGKGHENYIIIGHEKLPYSDEIEVKKNLGII